MQHVLFRNLWRVLGNPESPYGLGEFAFLNANNYSATTKEKYDAVISSFREDDMPIVFAASGDLNSLKNQFQDGRQLDQFRLHFAVINAVKYGQVEALGFLLSEGREKQLERWALNIAVDGAAKNNG